SSSGGAARTPGSAPSARAREARPAATPAMKEIRALTGVRGVAAITVFLAHTRETLQSRGVSLDIPDPIVRLFLCGGRQVDIFFVLSGFILAMLYRDWFVDGVRG